MFISKHRVVTIVIAAVLVVAVAAGVAGYSLFLKENWVDQPITLEISSGTVAVQRSAGSDWEGAANGATVLPGDWIWVKPDSVAFLKLKDGSVLQLQGGTQVHVDWSKSWGQRQRVTISVAKGVVSSWASAVADRGNFVVRTQTASLRTEGGVFSLTVEEEGRTSVNVQSGNLRVGALTVSSEGKLSVGLMSLSSGDTLAVEPLPPELTDRTMVQRLQNMVAEVVQRSVSENKLDVKVDGLGQTAGASSSTRILYDVASSSSISIPAQLSVPKPAVQDPQAGSAMAGTPGLQIDYKPVLSSSKSPGTGGTASGVSSPKPEAPPAPPVFSRALYGVTGPMGVAVDSSRQRVYVTESGGDRFTRIFDKDGKAAGTLAPPGTKASDRQPVYVAVSSEGKVYVVDRMRRQIDVYDASGGYLGVFDPGVSAGQGWSPLAVAFDKTGNLYVTDTTAGLQSLLAFRPNGEPMMKFGKEGTAAGEFSFPNGIAIDSKGGIYVADSNNYRVQVFSSRGEIVGPLMDGDKPVGVGLARGLAIDDRERMYIVDTLGHRVLVYQLAVKRSDVLPRPLFVIGSMGSDDGQFSYPNGVAVDQSGKIYVTDRENDRVQIWVY